MTVQDIITLSKAGFTAQQITQMTQPQMPQQMVQPQMPQQMVQQMPQQMVQQMPQQMVQPQMPQQMVQPQMAQPQMAQQMVQPQMPQMAQYMPVLPQTTQTDPLKDVMLQQYTNAGQNMYNMNDVVATMIGANAPVNTEKK